VKRHPQFSTLLACLILIIVGFSTYTTIFIRATQHPAINENNPDSLEGALAYMNRDQYGDWKILDPAFTLARAECSYSSRWTENKNNPTSKEELNFLWNYQIKEMYLRYFAWQFIGKEKHENRSWELVTLKGDLIKKLRGIDWGRYGLPLPLLFGLVGLVFHFSRDWKRALAVLSLFLATGIMIILYLNQYDPQPRERDYSYVGSFFTFSIWIGIGVAALQEKIREWLEGVEIAAFVSIGLTGIVFVAMPISMLAKDFKEHNRDGNYVAWDYAYNMLNSCEPNGIIFTNGDNDTFPLWYIQEVEGVRKDVRVVNLSLLNTPWYIEQLKNEPPQLPLQLKDESIQKLDPVFGTAYALNKWTAKWNELKSMYNEFTKAQYGTPYSVANFGILNNWGPTEATIGSGDEKFQWNISPKLSNYLRVQDIMILQILEDAMATRPVYFAVTVAPGNRLGLDSYLEMEGLVYRVTYEKDNGRSSMPRLNFDRMVQNISEAPDYENKIVNSEDYLEHINAGNGIYRYTNLDNGEVFFNENIQRLIQNYRSSFLQLGLEKLYSGNEDDKETTLELLDKMEAYFPTAVIPTTDADLDIQIGRIYKQAGKPEELKERLSQVVEREDVSLETQMYVGQIYLNEFQDYEAAISHFESLYNAYPYISDFLYTLVQAYAKADRMEDAKEKLDLWLMSHPNDSQAMDWLSILNQTVQ
jgi:tetratricopeptide (TPR) repeat protein